MIAINAATMAMCTHVEMWNTPHQHETTCQAAITELLVSKANHYLLCCMRIVWR